MPSRAREWRATRDVGIGGRFRIVIMAPAQPPVDVTWLRGAPSELASYGSADPFGDGPAQLNFPQLSAFEDFDAPELRWLAYDALVDIWWVPMMDKPAGWPADASGDMAVYENPLTNKRTLVAPGWVYTLVGGTWTKTTTLRGTKVYEGFIASIDVESDENADKIGVQCNGALFQVDGYLAKPFFPPRPQTLENLINHAFDKSRRPNLQTQPLVVEWPAGWTLRAPASGGVSDVFTPNVAPGKLWTGYTTRTTGSWDHELTSFVSGLLANMLVKPGSGVTPGNQWTVHHARQGDARYPAGRTPVLRVRDRFRPADFTLWTGAPGVKLSLTRDGTQRANVLYGTGTDLAGTTWRNSVISSDGARTDYLPLAASPEAYPVRGNPNFAYRVFTRESYVQFGAGFSQLDAYDSAAQTLQRDIDPGWSGTITLSTDPSHELTRWALQAGMSLRLRGFAGHGAPGLLFHIAEVQVSPNSGTVELTVDTRFRDLITVEEAVARTRDPLTPYKLLQLNRNSVTIEDIQAPWDYTAGAGCIPKSSVYFQKYKPVTQVFPYLAYAATRPPRDLPHWYVTCHANASRRRDRWAGPIPILMSEKGTIRRTEIACFDLNGHLVKIPFHVSLYYNNGIDYSFMPYDQNGPSPFITGAFQSIDPRTGGPWATPGHDPDPSFIMGWGNGPQPAGYSPGSKSAGALPTGLLIDDSSWSFDCSANNPNYDHLAKAGKEPASVITAYAMFYAEHDTAVYFQGRLYREEPGTQ